VFQTEQLPAASRATVFHVARDARQARSSHIRIKAIACPIILRELCASIAGSSHTIDPEFFDIGLHIEPDRMREDLQRRIDASTGQGYNAVVIGATLCGNGCLGLMAGDAPLVLPRAHDCITLILGSNQRYATEHKHNPATYWYTPAWIERFGMDKEKSTPYSSAARAAIRKQYVEQYGADNADYLMDMLHGWHKHYTRACFVSTGLAGAALDVYRGQSRQLAADYGWSFDELPGDTRLIDGLVAGEWPEADFLVVPPGCRIAASWDRSVVCYQPAESASSNAPDDGPRIGTIPTSTAPSSEGVRHE
jgi:hypothetical protein